MALSTLLIPLFYSAWKKDTPQQVHTFSVFRSPCSNSNSKWESLFENGRNGVRRTFDARLRTVPFYGNLGTDTYLSESYLDSTYQSFLPLFPGVTLSRSALIRFFEDSMTLPVLRPIRKYGWIRRYLPMYLHAYSVLAQIVNILTKRDVTLHIAIRMRFRRFNFCRECQDPLDPLRIRTDQFTPQLMMKVHFDPCQQPYRYPGTKVLTLRATKHQQQWTYRNLEVDSEPSAGWTNQ